MTISDEEQVLGHLELMCRALYRIGKKDGSGPARAQIRGVVAALEKMDETMEATLNGPRMQ